MNITSPYYPREIEPTSVTTEVYMGVIKYSAYYLREKDRRFAIYKDGQLHGETKDREQMEHVCSLLRYDGYKNITVKVFTANQETRKALDEQ